MRAKAIHQIHRCPAGKGPAVIVAPGTTFECGRDEFDDLIARGAAMDAGCPDEAVLPPEPEPVEANDEPDGLPLDDFKALDADFAKFDHDGDGKPGGSLPKSKRGPKKAKASRAKAQAARAAKTADTNDLI